MNNRVAKLLPSFQNIFGVSILAISCFNLASVDPVWPICVDGVLNSPWIIQHSQDLLTTHTQEEHINEWKCDKCSKVGCVRQAGIAHPPNVLPVHVSRLQRGFGPTVTFEKELTVQCDPPSPGKKKTQVKYALYGVIVYRSMGSNGGHYFAFVRSGRGANEQWYVADDDEVRSVTWPEVTREEPFMLLYEAVNVVPPLITEPVFWLQSLQIQNSEKNSLPPWWQILWTLGLFFDLCQGEEIVWRGTNSERGSQKGWGAAVRSVRPCHWSVGTACRVCCRGVPHYVLPELWWLHLPTTLTCPKWTATCSGQKASKITKKTFIGSEKSVESS